MFSKTKVTGIQRQVLISLCCYIGQLLVGISLNWTGTILAKIQDTSQSPLSVELSDVHISLIASVIYIGTLPGPYVVGWLSNFKGRKPCLVLAGVVTSISYLILVFSTNLQLMYCGRILAGFGVGSLCVTNLVYIGEIASTCRRGVLLTIIGVFHTGGSILMYACGLYFSYSSATSVGLIVGLIFTCCACFLPESPIYYLLQGDDVSLRKTLDDLGRSGDYEEMVASRKGIICSESKNDWLELFKDSKSRRTLIILIIANIFLQCSGIVSIVLFSGIIFDMAGTKLDPNISMIIVLSCELFGSMLVPFFIEICGRRRLMIISCFLCSLCMFILGTYFYFYTKGYPGISSFQWLPLVVLIMFFFAFDIGLGIIPTTLIGEMFKTSLRSKGSAVAITSSWVCGFLVSFVFGILLNVVGAYVLFWFFSCSSALAVIFTIKFVPETSGKSLLEKNYFDP